jgi:uridine kinase
VPTANTAPGAPLARSVETVVGRIDARRSRHPGLMVVALDGRSGAGKSTLARALGEARDGDVLVADDFWVGGEDGEWAARTPKERADGAIDWKRLRREVLEPLRAGRPAVWHPFDWKAGHGLAATTQELQPGRLVILDGAYSCRWELSDLVGLTVLVEAPEDERRRRLERREGPEVMPRWHLLWDDAERYYFTEVRPRQSFDLVVTG